jgi:hypothetical protein
MGILDEAIKEHLELKRQHGAGESELKQLEDEAFGAAERPGAEASPPDPLAEAPTELIAHPEAEAPKEEASKRAGEVSPATEEPSSRPAPRAEIADLQEAPPAEPQEAPPAEPQESEPPAEEESPAMEHEAVSESTEAEIPSGPSTEEREAIAEQPTEMYDVEEEYEEDDDFWDEKRLSDELDQALEAPSEGGEEEEVVSDEEDVLEETPDFLEETPEDDQLWFEQKPPKDFDFDD